MRLLAGADIGGREAAPAADAAWGAGEGGRVACRDARRLPPPRGAGGRRCPGEALKATLRPYQEAGVRWLGFLARLGLGACLADDMGLGKTLQVLALLLTLGGATASRGRASSSRRLRCSPTGRPRPSVSRRR